MLGSESLDSDPLAHQTHPSESGDPCLGGSRGERGQQPEHAEADLGRPQAQISFHTEPQSSRRDLPLAPGSAEAQSAAPRRVTTASSRRDAEPGAAISPPQPTKHCWGRGWRGTVHWREQPHPEAVLRVLWSLSASPRETSKRKSHSNSDYIAHRSASPDSDRCLTQLALRICVISSCAASLSGASGDDDPARVFQSIDGETSVASSVSR